MCCERSLLLVALLAFSAAELAFGLLVAATCSRAKIAAIVAPVLHLASLMPRYVFFRTGLRCADCRENTMQTSPRSDVAFGC